MDPNDLLDHRIQKMLSDAVYRGTLKAIGMYLLIGAVVAVVWWVIQSLASLGAE